MKNKLIWIAILMLSLARCEKDSSDQIVEPEKFTAPNIERAKQFVTSNNPNTDLNIGNRSSSESANSVTYWEGSKTKKYKLTQDMDVDILYTPIYVNSPRRDVKGFVATTENNGIIDSRRIYILYKSLDLSNGLNAYILIYKLNGNLDLVYNYVNGVSVPIPETTTESTNTSSDGCDADVSSMNAAELENWWVNCQDTFDEIDLGNVPIASDGPASGSTSAFDDWNNQWSVVNIPIEGFNSNYNTGDATPIDIGWHTPSYTIANAASIGNAIEVAYSSIEANWLRQMEQSNQIMLNLIAHFLNSNRIQNPLSDFNFENVEPEQFPISDEAIEYVKDIINALVGSANFNTQFDYIESVVHLANFLRLYGEQELDTVADYYESLTDDFNSMTMGEVHEIYTSLKQIADDIPAQYFNLIANVYFTDLVMPLITNAILNGSINLVTKLLQKIPIGNVMLGDRLNRWVQHISQLGVQGDQAHVRIVSTSMPVARAQEIFTTLTRNAIEVVEVSPGVIKATMGNGNYITFRTVSSTNFPATINFNFHQLLGTNNFVIKFSPL